MQSILIIEDDRGLQEVLRFRLESEGFAVLGAEDGGHGMELLYEARPAAVILDLMLPGIPGLNVLARIAGDPVLRVPVIVITAYEDLDGVLERRCLDLGAQAFVQKPLDAREIAALVRTAVGRDPAPTPPPQRKI